MLEAEREFAGDAGRLVGVDHFSASAACTVLHEQFGLTALCQRWGLASGSTREVVPRRSMSVPPPNGEQTGQGHERVIRMRAVVFAAEGELTVAERPEPVPGPREVLIETAAVGICGTDAHVLDG